MKTIFDLTEKEPEEVVAEFDEVLDIDGNWIEPQFGKSTDFSNCVLISEDFLYLYYLCYDKDSELNNTIICRGKKKK